MCTYMDKRNGIAKDNVHDDGINYDDDDYDDLFDDMPWALTLKKMKRTQCH